MNNTGNTFFGVVKDAEEIYDRAQEINRGWTEGYNAAIKKITSRLDNVKLDQKKYTDIGIISSHLASPEDTISLNNAIVWANTLSMKDLETLIKLFNSLKGPLNQNEDFQVGRKLLIQFFRGEIDISKFEKDFPIKSKND